MLHVYHAAAGSSLFWYLFPLPTCLPLYTTFTLPAAAPSRKPTLSDATGICVCSVCAWGNCLTAIRRERTAFLILSFSTIYQKASKGIYTVPSLSGFTIQSCVGESSLFSHLCHSFELHCTLEMCQDYYNLVLTLRLPKRCGRETLRFLWRFRIFEIERSGAF